LGISISFGDIPLIHLAICGYGSPEAHFLGAQEHDYSSPFFFDFLWKYQDLTEFFSASGLFAPPKIIHFGYGTTAVAPLINKLLRYFMSLAGLKIVTWTNFHPFTD
jgi:hypothetical protein